MALAALLLAVTASTASAQGEAPDALDAIASDDTFNQESASQEVDVPSYSRDYVHDLTPRQIVQRRAQVRAEQRQHRLAAQKWFGISNLRPIANPIPYYGVYSPRWAGSPWNPDLWAGYTQPAVVYHVARRVSRP